MTYRTYSVGHSLNGFTLIFEERSLFRELAGNWIDDVAHAILPEGTAWNLCQAVFHWQTKKIKTLDRVEIDYDTAVVLSDPGVWDYVDED